MQHRGLPARSPSAHPGRASAQSAFVDKDDGSPLLPGLFFKAGQSTRCQRRMAFSSRSTARRSGRWQLKPLAPSNRQQTRMIVNPGQVFDERGHAGQGPQGGLVTIGCGACQQGLGDPSGLLARQFGFTARRPLAHQRCAPALSPGVFPSVSNLPCHAQTARDLGRRIILTEELARLLGRFSIPAWSRVFDIRKPYGIIR